MPPMSAIAKLTTYLLLVWAGLLTWAAWWLGLIHF